MNGNDIMKALNNIDEKFIAESAEKSSVSNVKHKKYIKRITAAVLAAVFAVSTFTVIAESNVDIWLGAPYAKKDGSYTCITSFKGDYLNGDRYEGELPEKFVYQEPTYIPDGYVKLDPGKQNNWYSVLYSKDDYYYIYYSQYELDYMMHVKTAGEDAKFMIISGRKVFVTQDYKNVRVIWIDGDYMYSLSGVMSLEEITKIMDSVMPV